MLETVLELVDRGALEGEADAHAAPEREELVGAEALDEPPVAGEHHGEEDVRVEPGRREQPQLGEDRQEHLLRFVHDEHQPRERRVDVRLPAVAQDLRAAPAVVRMELDAEEVAHLAVEVGEAGLRTGEDAHLHVALGREPLGEDAQGHRLAGARVPGHEGEAALARELLDAPREGLDARCHVERLDRHIGSEGVPLEAVQREELLVHGSSPSSLGR
jgi:hypothetical protein